MRMEEYMYYALTINADQVITGVHESVAPILTDTFAANPGLVDDTVIIIPAPMDYQTYTHVLCYDEDGTRKPDLWCIENGYMELPPDKEIINGELVDKEIPADRTAADAEAVPRRTVRCVATGNSPDTKSRNGDVPGVGADGCDCTC